MSGSSALVIRGLRVCRAGREVVHGVDLTVPVAQVTALLGANGAGKSSLVLAVAGLLSRTAGNVHADSLPVPRRPEQVRRSGVAAVPEGHRVLGDLSVRDNLAVAAPSRRRTGPGIRRVLEIFPELAPLLNRPARTLSGGQQQMVALAQALVAAPRYLLVDELSLGLAPVVVARLAPVLGELAREGMGVLLIEQFSHVALAVADTAAVLDRGRITWSGSAAWLRGHPDVLQAAYLGTA